MSVIVVGVDGSEGGAAALRFAAEEAALRNATLRVVSAYLVPVPVYAGGVVPPVDFVTGFQEAAEAIVAKAASEAEALAPGITVETQVRQGHAADELVREAAAADLLVVGSRGLGGFRSLLLGSVSQQCAHHVPCPVVIVPSRDEG